MWRYVYTSSLEKADDIEAECISGLSKEEARRCVTKKVREILGQVFENELLNCTVDIHNMRAVIKVEGVHHVVAAMHDMEVKAS